MFIGGEGCNEMIDKLIQAMKTLMITSVTRHQQCFSMNTKVKGRNNAAPITQGMIGAAWCLPGRNPETGWRCAENWFVNVCCSFFIE
jgi:hypothetical protein